MRVVLINPPNSTLIEKHWADYAPLGIAYLAASLLAKGHTVFVFDGKLEKLTISDVVESVLEIEPELIGITCMTTDFPAVKEIAYRLKHYSNVPVITGGSHCNAVKEAALAECCAIDFCCFGEGEQLLNELISCMEDHGELKHVKGLIYRQGSRIIVNESRPYRQEYDSLPFPAWHLFPAVSRLSILTHRGCPFHCIFCSHNSGNIVRYRTVENVVEELLYINKHYHPVQVQFQDETFGFDPERTKSILRKIIELNLHKQMSFTAQTRVDRVDQEFMELLKAANFVMLELGVESGSEDVLKRIGKGIKISQVKKAIKLARNAGLKVWCKFILGHPHETIQEIRETVRLISNLNPDRLSVAIMTPYPGTPIFEMATTGKGGYRLLSREWKTFDKYTGAALELEKVSLARLKWIQIWCYLRLYLTNYRFLDLFHILRRNHTMVSELARNLIKQIVKWR